MPSPELDHTARIAYVNVDHGLVRNQYVEVTVPFIGEVVFSFKPQDGERVGWVDFRCDTGGECGYPQSFGGNPSRLCGATYLATALNRGQYYFKESSELIAHPEAITQWCARWLRRVQKSDTPHPPFPRSRSDEIAGVTAKLPLLTKLDEQTIRSVDSMMRSLEDTIRRRNGHTV